MTLSKQLLESLNQTIEENKNLARGKEIKYWDKGPQLKTGISKDMPEKGRGRLELEDGTILSYNQVESWWETRDRPGAGNDPKGYSKWVDDIYKAAGSPDDARTPELNPFK